MTRTKIQKTPRPHPDRSVLLNMCWGSCFSPEGPGLVSAARPGWSRPSAVCRSQPRCCSQDWRSAEIQDQLSGLKRRGGGKEKLSQNCRLGPKLVVCIRLIIKYVHKYSPQDLLYSGAVLWAWFCWPGNKQKTYLKQLLSEDLFSKCTS